MNLRLVQNVEQSSSMAVFTDNVKVIIMLGNSDQSN